MRFPFICGVTPHDVHVMVCVRSFTFRRWFAVMCGMSTVDPTYRRSPPTLFTEWPTPCWWEGLISTFTTDNPSLRRLIYGCSASSSRMYYGLLESPQEIRIRRRIHTLVQSPPRVLGTSWVRSHDTLFSKIVRVGNQQSGMCEPSIRFSIIVARASPVQ